MRMKNLAQNCRAMRWKQSLIRGKRMEKNNIWSSGKVMDWTRLPGSLRKIWEIV